MPSKKLYCRKRIIVFGFEGKNNKTEQYYFSHFLPYDDRYILKRVSCGVTDPINMVNSIKKKRSDFDYSSREDLTFLFIDGDCDSKKLDQIENIKSKLPKDIIIIVSNPTFELWFLNHYKSTSRHFLNNEELLIELRKYIPNYTKNLDVHGLISHKLNDAVINSKNQFASDGCTSRTEVYKLFAEKILKQ